jgi:hypothetical protein
VQGDARNDLLSTGFFNGQLSLDEHALIPLLVPFQRASKATRPAELNGCAAARRREIVAVFGRQVWVYVALQESEEVECE